MKPQYNEALVLFLKQYRGAFDCRHGIVHSLLVNVPLFKGQEEK